MALSFMVLSAVPKWNQQGILEGNAAEHTSLGTGYLPRVAMDPTGIPMIAIMGRGGTGA
jgi:hypothetical protein